MQSSLLPVVALQPLQHQQHQICPTVVQRGCKEDVTQPFMLKNKLPYLSAAQKEDQHYLNKTLCL